MSVALGYEGARRAANRAGSDWKEAAFDVFAHHAADCHGMGINFTTEEVRSLYEPVIGAPPDPRAWGQVALRAAREGLVKKAGVVRAQSRSVHGMYVTEWKPI